MQVILTKKTETNREIFNSLVCILMDTLISIPTIEMYGDFVESIAILHSVRCEHQAQAG